MGSKRDAFFFDFAAVAQGINLVAATIGQNGFAPAIKAVQTAGLLKNFYPRAQVQMVSIAQNDLSANIFFQFPLMYSFYGAGRADGHKYGGFYNAMCRFNATCAGIAVGIGMLKCKAKQNNGFSNLT